MAYYIVAREEGMTVGDANLRYQHNERCNNTYLNPDIDLSIENHYYKKPDKSYIKMFQEMEERGLFSTRHVRLKDNQTKIGSEIIVCVAGDYFQSREQAVEFFKVANDALNEFFTVHLPDGTKVKGEDLCMSSVVHCDEKSYGLHYTTATCVAREKKRKRTKKQMEEGKSAKSEGWYCQLSHSGFWDSDKDSSGKIVYSYSRLNDVIADAYAKVGYTDIQRGQKGSTAKHLHPNEYKAMMREMEQKANDTLALMDTKRIAGKIIIDESQYENLIDLQEKISLQKIAIEKSQELLDAEQQALKKERIEIKRREIAAEKKINKDYEGEYSRIKAESKEREQELFRKKEEISKMEEIISFWEQLFEMLLGAIKKIIGLIDAILHKDLKDEEREQIHLGIVDAYENIKYGIETAEMIRNPAMNSVR